ncbi:hypothetical protein [Sphingomonas nostoxanthinifaciens]|uniref:hypothetical protein n=1 Tax=Sphingomonas nostoxanthinifaciens TaxID=2872652 RepID=UPI001CC1CF4D|nr:hypothetical protein [Sphingomonas nostoxanthinifaciens]UAK25865.1 hypothetical protein K8P63_07015 [Sphingomonas nostoxanthinifaciens]
MGSTTAAGSAIAISAAAPATFDATGYAALTYTEIGQVEKIGAIGAVYAKVEFQPLKGAKQKFKGSKDNGTLAPSLAHDSTDAGQTLLRTAADSNANYSFMVTYADGAKRYFQGRVFGYPETTDGADTVLMANPTVEINTDIVKVPA